MMRLVGIVSFFSSKTRAGQLLLNFSKISIDTWFLKRDLGCFVQCVYAAVGLTHPVRSLLTNMTVQEGI